MAKCGNCKESHATADEVRACYGMAQSDDAPRSHRPASYESEDFRGRMKTVADQDRHPITERQKSYARSLIEERYEGTELTSALESLDGMSKADASDLIKDLLGQERLIPKDGGEWPSEEELPEGRYALDTQPGGANSIAFWRVSRPSNGRWAGFVFVVQLVGGVGDWREFRTTKEQAHSIADRIVKVGAREAAARFGHEAGQCGRCLSPLSVDRSRAAGYGKICAEKLGWPW